MLNNVHIDRSRNANVVVCTHTYEQPFYHGREQTETFAVHRRKMHGTAMLHWGNGI